MFVEFINVTKNTAYYAVGGIDDLHAVPYMKDLVFTDCGDTLSQCLERAHPVLDRLTDVDPGDSFQIRIFTAAPKSRILTDRYMTRGKYWANWRSAQQRFTFQRITD